MNHPFDSLEAMIRDGISLKDRISLMVRQLEVEEEVCKENQPILTEKQHSGSVSDVNQIHFMSPLPGGLKNTISDIFSMVCNFRSIDNAEIYMIDQQKKHLNLVCHYNLPPGLLARVITSDFDSWQIKTVCDGLAKYECMHTVPLPVKITYEQFGLNAIAIIPLTYNSRIVGCLNLASKNETFLTGFERIVIEGLATRISRTIALHVAQARLTFSNMELNKFMLKLALQSQPLDHQLEKESLTGFFFGIKDEINRLGKAISLATENVLLKLQEGEQKRELPYIQKKVETILNDIDLIAGIISRLRTFCNTQSETLEQGLKQQNCSIDKSFLHNMTDFFDALEVLVVDDTRRNIPGNAFIAGQFKPLTRPVTLVKLKIKIDRLNPN